MQGQGQHFYSANIEGLAEWNINPTYWADRKPGLSAMFRVKDEAEWVLYALDSIVDWHDEIAICLQGVQTDGTDRLVKEWAAKHPGKAFVYEYPFESLPNGPDHDKQARGSVHERAYFYNWCMAKTTCSFLSKWDGDMVAADWLGREIRRLMETTDAIRFRGTDVVGPRLDRRSRRPCTANEPRILRVTPKLFWYTGAECEYCSYSHADGHVLSVNDGYLHFKWAKAFASSSKDWAPNWREDPVQRTYYEKWLSAGSPGHAFDGPWPNLLQDLVAQRRAQYPET